MTKLSISKETSLPELKSAALFQKEIPEYLLTCNKHLRTIVKARRAAADRAHGTAPPRQRLLTEPEETYLSANRSRTDPTNNVPSKSSANMNTANMSHAEHPNHQPQVNPSWSEEPRTETSQPIRPETPQMHQQRTATPQPDPQCGNERPDPYRTISELTMQVQQLQLQQEQLKATSVLRSNPSVHTQDNMATPFQQPAGSVPTLQQQFQQYTPRQPSAYPDEESRYSRRNEHHQRTKSNTRPGTPSNLIRRRSHGEHLRHKLPEDTFSEDEEIDQIIRSDNLTETELQQLPVKMPRFGIGDYFCLLYTSPSPRDS